MVIEHTHTLLYVTKVVTEIVNFTLTQALNAQSVWGTPGYSSVVQLVYYVVVVVVDRLYVYM